MATINKSVKRPPVKTHEGGRAVTIPPLQELRRSVLACLLFEGTFYEDGVDIANRIANLVAKLCEKEKGARQVLDLALEARTKYKLRHVPLLLVREVARNWKWGTGLAEALDRVIQRADELAEFVALYWLGGKTPLAKQVKRGLALAFNKFNAYDLAKYNRDGAVKLRDVLFLVHAKPKNTEQAALWKQLVDDTLPIPQTWENRLSAGQDKKVVWESMLQEKQLGALALIRNLRNMAEAQVDSKLIREGLKTMKVDRVLPFRFIAAERYGPTYSRELEAAMIRCVAEHEKLAGNTVLLVDVSGSMDQPLSAKSDLRAIDAASALAILLMEIGECSVFTFSDLLVQVPSRHGFGLRDAIATSQRHNSTMLGAAVAKLNTVAKADRLIVITDEQCQDNLGKTAFERAYMVNVSTNQHGVGYGAWTHIDGMSEAIVDYIIAYEAEVRSGS